MINNPWGVEVWGKELVKCWERIKDSKGLVVRAYAFDDLPEALTTYPCALSFLSAESADVSYSLGGISQVVWRGETEFHLTPDIKKQNLSYVWQF
jgi:hypothetical protein